MNFEDLKQQIEDAARKAFLEVYEKHGAEKIYSFALYSDEGAMTVCPAANTLENLKEADEDDFLYYKYEPAEWAYEMDGAEDEFDEICTRLRNVLDQNEEEKWFAEFQGKLYKTCIEVLEKLKNEDFFRKITGGDIFLIFAVSDYEFEKEEQKKMIARLNDNVYKDEYLGWMDTLGTY